MNRYLTLAGSILLFIAAAGIYTFLMFQINDAVSNTATARTAVASVGEQESSERTLNSFLSDTEGERATLAGFVTKDSDVALTLQTIESAATADKVSATITSVSVEPSSFKYHESVQVQITAKGSFSALALFATELESLPQASHLSSMGVNPSDKEKGWDGSFTLEFLKEKVQTP